MKSILFVGAECMPFAATGGLGDVIGSLPKALAENKENDIRVALPLYSAVKPEVRAKMTFIGQTTVKLSWREQYCGLFEMKEKGVTYYFIDNEYYFARDALYGFFDDGERFAFFCSAVMKMMEMLNWYPDILHAHDWQSALTVIYAKTILAWKNEMKKMKTIFTIHNIEYQGQYDHGILQDVFTLPEESYSLVENKGCINLMKGAIQCADKVTTVSPRYAQEILTEEYAHGLQSILKANRYKLSGILNGIDYDYYNPATDKALKANFTPDDRSGKALDKKALQNEVGLPARPDVPVISIISRLASHKGLDILTQCLDDVARNGEIQLVVLGKGEERFENYFRDLEWRYRDKVRALITYDRDLSRRVYAGTDIFLMPSRSEPCGLSQMIASRYGAIPVVRETGGLYDSIKPLWIDGSTMHGNGLTFANYSPWELKDKIESAIRLYYDYPETKEALVEKVMTTDFSWKASAVQYQDLYDRL